MFESETPRWWSTIIHCFQKSDAKIEITITTTNLTRIKYPLSSFNYHISGANFANFNKIHRTVFDQQWTQCILYREAATIYRLTMSCRPTHLQSGLCAQWDSRSRQDGGGSWTREHLGCKDRRMAPHLSSPAPQRQKRSASASSGASAEYSDRTASIQADRLQDCCGRPWHSASIVRSCRRQVSSSWQPLNAVTHVLTSSAAHSY